MADIQFIPWQPARGHAGLSNQQMAKRCALTTKEELAKLTSSPEFLAREEARQLGASKSARSWLSWPQLRCRRAVIVALLLTMATFYIGQAALPGLKQPALIWPSTPSTGTQAIFSLPAGLYLAAQDESAAALAAVSASQPGDFDAADTPRVDRLGLEVIQEPNDLDTDYDSTPPEIEVQIQATIGQESEVVFLDLSPANNKPEMHVSQERPEDADSEATNNKHNPSTEAAAQRPAPFAVTEALWEVIATLALSTAVSRAARWQKTRMQRVIKKNEGVSDKGNLASKKRTPTKSPKRRKSCAENSSNKENEPEHPHCLQEKLQDGESRLHQAEPARQLEANSATLEAQQLRQKVEEVWSYVQVLEAERNTLRDQNTALEALLAQQAADASPQPSTSTLLSNEMLETILGNFKDGVCQLIFDLSHAKAALGDHQHSPRCPLADCLDTTVDTLKQLLDSQVKDGDSWTDWLVTPALTSPAPQAATAANPGPTSARVSRLPKRKQACASPAPATPVRTRSALKWMLPVQTAVIDRLRNLTDETVQIIQGACLRVNSASPVEPEVATQMAGTSAAHGYSAAADEMDLMHTALALVTFRVRNLTDLLAGSAADPTDLEDKNASPLYQIKLSVSLMTDAAKFADSAFLEEQRGENTQDAAACRLEALAEFREFSQDLLEIVERASAMVIAQALPYADITERASASQQTPATPVLRSDDPDYDTNDELEAYAAELERHFSQQAAGGFA